MGNEKDDLTLLEEMGEFEHQEDTEAERMLGDFNTEIDSSGDSDSDLAFSDDLSDSDSDFDSGSSFDNESDDDSFSLSDNEDYSSDSFENSADEPEFTNSYESSGDEVEFSNSYESSNDETDYGSSFESSDSDSDFDTSFDSQDDDFETTTDESFLEEEVSFDTPPSPSEEPESLDFSSEDESEELIKNETVDTSFDESAYEEPEPAQPSFESSMTKPEPSPVSTYEQGRENVASSLKEARDFSANLKSVDSSSEASPPYSVLIKNITFKEDEEEIRDFLTEIQIIDESNSNDFQLGFDNQAVIIPQISEYLAVYICNHLRHLNVSLQMGPAAVIHPTKSYDTQTIERVSKSSITQNKRHGLSLRDQSITLEDIILATNSRIESHTIEQYIDLVSHYITVSVEELKSSKIEESNDYQSQVYETLKNRLKQSCLKKGGNGILDVTFNTTPIKVDESMEEPNTMYQVTATGNVVWLKRI